MMLTSIYHVLPVLIVLVYHFQLASSLKMVDLDGPNSSLVNETIELSCLYSLQQRRFDNSNSNNKSLDDQDERLYVIKWYKDEREFYRYSSSASSWRQKLAIEQDGIQIDLERSNNQSVTLANVSLKTSGTFKCEVSTEAPNFATKSIERKIDIFALPVEGPSLRAFEILGASGSTKRQLSANVNELKFGSKVQLECWSGESKPPAQLDLLINSVNLSSLGASMTNQVALRNKRLVTINGQQIELKTNQVNQSQRQHTNANASTTTSTSTANFRLDQVAQTSGLSVEIDLDPSLIRLLDSAAKSEHQSRGISTKSSASKAFGRTRGNLTRHSSLIGASVREPEVELRQRELHLACVSRVLHSRMSTSPLRLMLLSSQKPSSQAEAVGSARFVEIREKSAASTSSLDGFSKLTCPVVIVVVVVSHLIFIPMIT